MKQFRFVLGIFIGALLLSLPAAAVTTEVCATCAVNSVKDAVLQASPYDTILVRGGTYLENNIIIDKPLVLLGENAPVIDGQYLAGIIEIKSDSVTLRGFVLQNVGLSYTQDFAAIHIGNSNYFVIADNVLKDVFFGIYVQKSDHGLIQQNTISSQAVEEFNSGNGIHIWHCKNITVTGNHLSRLRDGIYLEFVEESLITDNISTNNIRYGLHFMFSNHDDYYDNVFINNGAGVAVMFSKFINMKRNKFLRNWGTASFGLLLKEIYDAEIEQNLFEENTIGVNIEGTNRINYKNNRFVGNGWAVKFTGGCYANIFTGNDFLSNSFDVSYNTKMNDNLFDNNYWSSYAGYDLNKDGIGDVPYRPVKLFSYIVNRTPETIILLRSLFIDILNFSEKVSPVFTPDDLMDTSPSMKIIND